MQMSNNPHVPPSLLLYLFDRRMSGSQVGTNTEEEKEMPVLVGNRRPILQHAFRSLVKLQYWLIRLGFQAFLYHF